PRKRAEEPAAARPVGQGAIQMSAGWTSGDDPMTGAQANYLKTLSEQAHMPEQFAEDLSEAEASKRIDALREKVGLAGNLGAVGFRRQCRRRLRRPACISRSK